MNHSPVMPATLKVLVTGAKGQLGSELVRMLSPVFEVYGFTRQQLDVTRFSEVRECVRQLRPDVVIHAAAYTQVDLAESHPDAAYAVNAYGTRNLAVAAEEAGAAIVYISTDYVFDGTSRRPYREFDPVGPLNVYGKSKCAGEQIVQTLSRRHYIVRTSWLYGPGGPNFVRTMLQLAKTAPELRIVDDQIGSPTYTADLAQFIGELILTGQYGIYHASNQGSCSWHEFAREIFARTELQVTVTPVRTQDFPRPAPRPSYSVLDHMAIRLNGLSALRPWQEALQDCLQHLE